jgi:hypothetical protein
MCFILDMLAHCFLKTLHIVLQQAKNKASFDNPHKHMPSKNYSFLLLTKKQIKYCFKYILRRKLNSVVVPAGCAYMFIHNIL